MSRIFHQIPSFAPDYSGPASVLHDMGGMIVFCDVGGCFGNYLAFDEPRMGFAKKVFTLGFQETDLVMGVDRVAREKIVTSFRRLGGKFVALIGSPTATLTGADFRGLCVELQRELGVPAFYVDTTGLTFYERGQEKIFRALMDYALHHTVDAPADVHIFGATPLDAWDYGQQGEFLELLCRCGAERPLIWGAGETLEHLGSLDRSRLNIAVSVSGLRAVRELHERFGTPYRIGFPVGKRALAEWENELRALLSGCRNGSAEAEDCAAESPLCGRRVLIVGEQVASNMLRRMLRQEFGCGETDVASFFTMDRPLMEAGDWFAQTESGYVEELRRRAPYDVVVGDDFLTEPLPYAAQVVRIPSIAISGLAFVHQSPVLFGEKGSRYFAQCVGNDASQEKREQEKRSEINGGTVC